MSRYFIFLFLLLVVAFALIGVATENDKVGPAMLVILCVALGLDEVAYRHRRRKLHRDALREASKAFRKSKR